jgi:carbon monoxide dehydrogenase subunit G
MELEHTFTVAVPVEQAWEVLLDLERVAPCMPGATLTSYEGGEFTGTVRVKLGPVTMTFAGQGRFAERDPDARRVVIEAAGKDKRGGGTARATVRASLRGEGDAATVVQVHSDLVVTGRAAQFGRGMIADVSSRLLDQFTDCLAGQLGTSAEPAAAAGAAPDATLAAADATPAAPDTATTVPATPGAAEPIDLLGVTGVRAATGRLVPYLLAFLAGAVVGGVVVALLLG